MELGPGDYGSAVRVEEACEERLALPGDKGSNWTSTATAEQRRMLLNPYLAVGVPNVNQLYHVNTYCQHLYIQGRRAAPQNLIGQNEGHCQQAAYFRDHFGAVMGQLPQVDGAEGLRSHAAALRIMSNESCPFLFPGSSKSTWVTLFSIAYDIQRKSSSSPGRVRIQFWNHHGQTSSDDGPTLLRSKPTFQAILRTSEANSALNARLSKSM